MKPFHLSFVVPDKEPIKRFYVDLLGCQIGRDIGAWFDILFFGHQLTIHSATAKMPAYKIDHFGPILCKQEWLTVKQNLTSNNIDFVMPPTIYKQGQSNESGKVSGA